jgi:hypothetical protein
MIESIQNLISLFGSKGLEIYQEELELEFQGRGQKVKEKMLNGIHWYNISIWKRINLKGNLQRKLKGQLE